MGKSHNIGKDNPNWKGGRYKERKGYIKLYLPSHPRASRYRPYIAEHVVIMELKLGRHLKEEEVVHHINGIKDDNNPKNLMLFPNNKEHIKFHQEQNGRTKQKI